jgi:hypothetical protein
MSRINAYGDNSAKVTSQREINDLLHEFNGLVQEAVLIEGREYNLRLTFTAHEIVAGDDHIAVSEAF